MILYYAMGGGLGHLTRARAFRYTTRTTGQIALMTASPQGVADPVMTGFEVISVPPQLADDRPAYRNWLRETIDRLRPVTLILDVFPAGIVGEFCDLELPPELQVVHLARLLRWNEYSRVMSGTPPRIDRTVVLEPLTAAHLTFVESVSSEVTEIQLGDEPAELGGALVRRLEEVARPWWLIVHSGPDDETIELIHYADELRQAEGSPARFVLVSPSCPAELPAHVIHLAHYPAWPMFQLADRIISAAGFNVMRQTEAYRDRHYFIPFPRRYDDQFTRAARRRRAVIAC